MSDKAEQFDQWAIVDVMGHQRYIGRVTEQVVAGAGFVRVDVPETSKQPAWTKLIGTGSIYAISPVTEEIARAMAEQRQQAPIAAYEMPARITAATDERPAYDDPQCEDDDDIDF